MKGKKKTLIILLCLLACFAAVAAIISASGKKDDGEQDDGQTLIEIKKTNTDDIIAFTFKKGDEQRSFEYMTDKWVDAFDGDFPLSATFVSSALEDLSQISAVKRIDSPEALSEYGLESPEKTVYFTDRDGNRLTVYIGNYNSFNGYYYARFDEDDDVYLIDSKLPSLCDKTEKDTISLDSLPTDMTGATFVSLTSVERSVTSGDESAESLWKEISGISMSNYKDSHVDSDEAEEYGLIAAELNYSTTQTSETDYSSSAVTATVSHTADFSFALSGEELLFTYGDSGILYTVKAEDYPTLTEFINEL